MPTARELAQYRLATVGMLFQTSNLIPTRTAIENVELPMILAGRSPPEHKPRPIQPSGRTHSSCATSAGWSRSRLANRSFAAR